MTVYKPPKRFEREIQTVVNVAEQFTDGAAPHAAFNLLQYLAGCAATGSEPRREAVDYLVRAVSKLTTPQRSKLASALSAKRGRPTKDKIDEKEIVWRQSVEEAVRNPSAETIYTIISALPNLTSQQRLDLAKRVTTRRGQPSKYGLKQHDAEWWESMRIGAEVSRVYKEKERTKSEKPLMGEPGPYEAAIEFVAAKYGKGESFVKGWYSKFRQFEDLGIFRDNDLDRMASEAEEED